MHRKLFCGSLLLGLLLITHSDASENSLNEVQEVLRYTDIVDMLQNVEKSGCSCVTNNCGCCADLDIPEIKLKALSCVNTSYLPEEYGVRVTMTINQFTVINVTVSAKNPPPICFAIPYLKNLASICIDLYDLDVINKTFRGCVKIEFHIAVVVHFSENLGCFHIPLKDQKSVEEAKLIMDGIRKSRLQKLSEMK